MPTKHVARGGTLEDAVENFIGPVSPGAPVIECVRVLGGPLNGKEYNLQVEPGVSIQLHTAAGVCEYRFATTAQGYPVLDYVGPAPPDPQLDAAQALEHWSLQ